MPRLFGSDGERYSDLGVSDDEAGEPHWDMGYEEARRAVEEKGEITDLLEGDSMMDGEEYLVEDKEEGELAYEGKGHRISPDYLFALFNYPAAERWQYLAAEKGDEGRIVLGSYYSLKKEATRVACPAFEDLPVSLNHELGMAQQTDLRKLLVEYREVFATEAEPLGTHPTVLHHIATGDGLKPDAGKVEAISMMAAPVDVRGVREFLGCTSYYRRFIKGYAKVAHSLTQLLHKDNPFEWTDKSHRRRSNLTLVFINSSLSSLLLLVGPPPVALQLLVGPPLVALQLLFGLPPVALQLLVGPPPVAPQRHPRAAARRPASALLPPSPLFPAAEQVQQRSRAAA
ncbi:unnamed protein product [Closterium sp. NIES-65]|nr:unnamed protein product [Closterium sp. NIES-65]